MFPLPFTTRRAKGLVVPMPTLPVKLAALLKLNCSSNHLTQLDNLPCSLQKLCCISNQIVQLDNLPSTLLKLGCQNNRLTQLDNLPFSLIKLHCYGNKMENNNLEYWKERTKNKKLKLLKEKYSAIKIQKIWRKYWYDIYKYELIDGEYIGFCRFIERSYSIINGSST